MQNVFRDEVSAADGPSQGEREETRTLRLFRERDGRAGTNLRVSIRAASDGLDARRDATLHDRSIRHVSQSQEFLGRGVASTTAAGQNARRV